MRQAVCHTPVKKIAVKAVEHIVKVMGIVTRAGDDGKTMLRFGARVSKSHPRIQAHGAVEEATAAIGLARAHIGSEQIREQLRQLQEQLLLVCSELTTNTMDTHKRDMTNLPHIDQQHLEYLDALVEEYEAQGFEGQGWVFPGQTKVDAFLHQARAITRRAERNVQMVRDVGENCSPMLLSYLNRLSDVLWLLAAYSARGENG